VLKADESCQKDTLEPRRLWREDACLSSCLLLLPPFTTNSITTYSMSRNLSNVKGYFAQVFDLCNYIGWRQANGRREEEAELVQRKKEAEVEEIQKEGEAKVVRREREEAEILKEGAETAERESRGDAEDCRLVEWRQDNGNGSNQESKFDFLATRQCLVKIDEGQ